MHGPRTCKNCETPIREDFQYCPRCGQRTNEELTIQVLFNNTIHNYFSVDARFFKSIIPLIIKPGMLARRFVDGKRQLYLHPAQYYLFISVIFFFLFSLVTRDHDEQINSAIEKGLEDDGIIPADSVTIQELASQNVKIDSAALEALDTLDQLREFGFNPAEGGSFNMDDELDSLIEAGAPMEAKLEAVGLKEDAGKMKKFVYTQGLKIYERRGGGLLQAFYDIIPIAMFFLLPVFALLLKLFYWKSGRFSHHIVFSFYYFTFIFLVLSLAILINFWIEIPGWIMFLGFLLMFIYLWISSKNFYRQALGIVFFKSWMVGFTYLFFVIPISALILVLVSFALY